MDTYKVEKTQTYESLDGSQRTFYNAGDEIPLDEARWHGMVKDKRATEMKEAAEARTAQGAAEDADNPAIKAQEAAAKQTRNAGAAPENRSA